MIAAQHMNMIFSVGTLKHSGNQVVVNIKSDTADRTPPRYIVIHTIVTAAYMHKPVYAADGGWKGNGFDLFSFSQFG
jgi:hypothetical protein